MRNPKVGDGIRIAAGVYLIYLAYQILKDGIIGGEMTGRSYAAGIIFSILFIVGGAGIAAFSVRHLMRLRKEEGQQKALQDKAATERKHQKCQKKKRKRRKVQKKFRRKKIRICRFRMLKRLRKRRKIRINNSEKQKIKFLNTRCRIALCKTVQHLVFFWENARKRSIYAENQPLQF